MSSVNHLHAEANMLKVKEHSDLLSNLIGYLHDIPVFMQNYSNFPELHEKIEGDYIMKKITLPSNPIMVPHYSPSLELVF